MFWAISSELSWKWSPSPPCKGEEVNYMMIRLYLRHKLPQLQDMEINWPWNWRINCTIKMRVVRPSVINLMTVRADCAVSACSPPHPRLEKLLHNWSSEERAGLWTNVCPPYWLLGTEIKQIFLSTSLACLLAFEWQAAAPHLLVTLPLIADNCFCLLPPQNDSPSQGRAPLMGVNPV